LGDVTLRLFVLALQQNDECVLKMEEEDEHTPKYDKGTRVKIFTLKFVQAYF